MGEHPNKPLSVRFADTKTGEVVAVRLSRTIAGEMLVDILRTTDWDSELVDYEEVSSAIDALHDLFNEAERQVDPHKY